MKVVWIDFNPVPNADGRLRCRFILLFDHAARVRQGMAAARWLIGRRIVVFEQSGEERAGKAHNALSGRRRLQARQSATFAKTPTCPERSRACGVGEPAYEVRPLPHGCHWREAVPFPAQPVARLELGNQFSITGPAGRAEALLPVARRVDKASSGAMRGGAA